MLPLENSESTYFEQDFDIPRSFSLCALGITTSPRWSKFAQDSFLKCTSFLHQEVLIHKSNTHVAGSGLGPQRFWN